MRLHERGGGFTVYVQVSAVDFVIPLVDLKAQYGEIREEIEAAVLRVIESSQVVLGPEVEAFEEEFARECGSDATVAVNSGTSALHLALLVAGVGPGAEVITSPHTFIATVGAIRYTGATPVFADIDPVSYTIDPKAIEAVITERTRAIVPVHLYGQPADMDPILEIARKHQLVVIEDAAQAHLAEYKGRRVGSIGDLGCFSFYPGKNLGAYGEGGAITLSDPDRVRELRMLRDWGAEEKFHHELPGFNYRMDAIQGAVLRVKLRRLPAWTEARRSRADLYRKGLDGVDVVTPRELAYARHVYNVYAVRVSQRAMVQKVFSEKKIQTSVHYPVPVHLQPCNADLGYGSGRFPNAEALSAEVLSLPMYAELSSDQIEEVCRAMGEAGLEIRG